MAAVRKINEGGFVANTALEEEVRVLGDMGDAKKSSR